MATNIDDVVLAQQQAEGRRAEIRGKIEKLRKQELEIQTEIDELTIAVRTLHRILADSIHRRARGTCRRLIDGALNTSAADGKTAGEIRDHIRDRYGMEIPINTVSVTLNRLQAASIADLRGRRWSLA